MTRDLAAAVADELTRVHRAHTVILYGSRARGDATADSDVDVASFADVETTSRDARRWAGVVLDAFVYPTAVLETRPPDPDLLKLRGGAIVRDDRGLAGGLLASLDELHRAGPKALTEDDARMRRVWAHKMVARISRTDVEAHYRRHWLLTQLLEDHFALRGRWYRGPKESLAELRVSDPDTFAAFARALAPGADLPAVVDLVGVVVGPDPG